MPHLVFGRGLGCRKDPVDTRDYPLTRIPPALRAKLPAIVDYTDKMVGVSDQGDEGTCVGFATVDGMKEYQETKEWKKTIQLSVRYVYSEAQKIDGYPDDEEGTDIRCAMKVLNVKGVPPQSCWKYKPHQTNKPCNNADDLAMAYRIDRYVRLKTLAEMKESLFVNGPFVAGVEVYESWMTAAVDKAGVIPMPKKDEELLGGHAICIVGYDDKKKRFKFKNSWSRGWGDDGYGYLLYTYMTKYGMDCWSGKDKLHDPDMMKSIKAISKGLIKEGVWKAESFG
jgi:C1A family cysteine protease